MLPAPVDRYHSVEMIKDSVDVINDPEATVMRIRQAAMILRDTASDLCMDFRHSDGRKKDITPEGVRMSKRLSDIFTALNPMWVEQGSRREL